jgi:hypothetical protein
MSDKYQVVYFRDDHNRILRVARHRRTGEVSLHLLEEGENGGWIPLPRSGDLMREYPKVELPAGLIRLQRKAVDCPLFQRC